MNDSTVLNQQCQSALSSIIPTLQSENWKMQLWGQGVKFYYLHDSGESEFGSDFNLFRGFASDKLEMNASSTSFDPTQEPLYTSRLKLQVELLENWEQISTILLEYMNAVQELHNY